MAARAWTIAIAGCITLLILVGLLGWVLLADRDSPPRYADASTAGVRAGATLTPSGSVTVDTAGTVIEGLDIAGTLTVNASDVTVRDTRVSANAVATVRVAETATGVRFERVTVEGRGLDGAEGSSGIVGPGAYVHGLGAPGKPHYDGIQIDGGVEDVIITGSTVVNDHSQTSAVMVDNYFGPATGIRVERNRLVGGGYSVYADGRFSDDAIEVTYAENRLGRGSYGYAVRRNASVTWTGNVDDGRATR